MEKEEIKDNEKKVNIKDLMANILLMENGKIVEVQISDDKERKVFLVWRIE